MSKTTDLHVVSPDFFVAFAACFEGVLLRRSLGLAMTKLEMSTETTNPQQQTANGTGGLWLPRSHGHWRV